MSPPANRLCHVLTYIHDHGADMHVQTSVVAYRHAWAYISFGLRVALKRTSLEERKLLLTTCAVKVVTPLPNRACPLKRRGYHIRSVYDRYLWLFVPLRAGAITGDGLQAVSLTTVGLCVPAKINYEVLAISVGVKIWGQLRSCVECHNTAKV